jgi:anti-sigma factor RsiW
MARSPSEAELEAYLDEALPAEAMAEIERALRKDAKLTQRLAAINGRRDAGVHTVGEIWRRLRLSCPTRDQLGS